MFLGMYRRFGVIHQGLLLSLLFSFFGDFGAFSGDFRGGVLRTFS
jgi:hypothetical protein